MQIVNLPDGSQAQFPADMKQEQIESVLQQHFATSKDNSASMQAQGQTISSAPIAQAPSVADTVVKAASKIPGIQGLANTLEPITSPIVAFGGGLKQGLVDAAHDTGALASNIIQGLTQGKGLVGKANTALTSRGNEAYQALSNNPIDQINAQQHPGFYGVGGGLGYVGGLAGSQAPLINPLTRGVQSGLGAIAPTIAKSPTISGAVSNAVVGGGMGAASNPNNPLAGATTGALTGGALGAIGGGLGHQLKRGGDIVDFETNNLKAAGIDPASYEGISRITKSLKDNGVDMNKINVQTQISHKIGDMITKSGPLQNLDTAPAETIANMASQNYGTVTAKVNKLIEPLTTNTQTFNADLYNASKATAINDIGSAQIRKALPSAPENATFDQLWTTRQKLDSVISSARIQATTGKILKSDMIPLMQTRDALTADLTKSAETIGLGKQFAEANAAYKNEVLPFSVFKTQSGKLLSPDDVNDAMKKINTMLNPRISPDFRGLNKIAASLGPDGQKLVGQAMLQNMYRKSLNDKGLVDPKTFFTQLKKANVSGLDNRIWGLETRQTALGLKQVIDGADEAMKLGTIPTTQQPAFYQRLYDWATKNRGGIAALRLIGSSKTPQSQARAAIQKLITGLMVTGTSNPTTTP